MKNLAALFILLQLLLAPVSVAAQGHSSARIVSAETWVEEWDPATRRWVRIVEDGTDVTSVTTITTHTYGGRAVSETRQTASVTSSASFQAVPAPLSSRPALARYGPFKVIDGKRAQLVGATGSGSPAFFAAMIRDYPALEVLELVEAPGTSNDIANLAVGRAIRTAGLHTYVPNGGSVRSGAVELFLAGQQRTMEPGAQFAVHSWIDHRGREPDDFAADAPENRLYLDYYIEMGMSERRASNFYAMTNSVPHAGALWLRADDMAAWIAPSRPVAQVKRIAELGFLDNPEPLSIAAAVPLSAFPDASVVLQAPFPLAVLSDSALKTLHHAPLVLRDVS